jgi:hypothetical protein
MKRIFSIALAGTLVLAAGCTTSSQVQELIDATHRDYLDKSAEHEASINALKQSSAATLETGKENAEAIAGLKTRLEEVLAQLKLIQGYADAAKIMSAANTVKVADLEEAVQLNEEALDVAVAELQLIDKLFEEVMIRHYQMIADSANAATAALQEDDAIATNGITIGLAEPIEIVAPDTSSPTNTVPEQ